jgi:hypothetical protein
MIRDAGFEVEGNPLWEEEAREPGPRFRLEGVDGEILKPSIARREAP